MSNYYDDEVVRTEAAKWFPDCERLLVWDWDRNQPGRCHPLSVVAAWEEGRPFPTQVAAREEDFLGHLLKQEWRRSGLSLETVPPAPSRTDADGRRTWELDLVDAAPEIRVAVGRALLREAHLPAWDFDWENLALPEYAKTCVISTDDGRYLYDPAESEWVSLVEELRPEPEEPSYVCLLFPGDSYLEVWRHPEGMWVGIRIWHDPKVGAFTAWEASSSPRSESGSGYRGHPFPEEHRLSLGDALAVGMAFFYDPRKPPEVEGVWWHAKV